MRALILGFERMGMVCHLAKCFLELGFSEVIGLVNNPQVLAKDSEKIAKLRLHKIQNPFDPAEVTVVSQEYGANDPRTPFVCVQDRLLFCFVEVLKRLRRANNEIEDAILCEGLIAARVKPFARKAWRVGVDSTRFTVVCTDTERTRHWANIGKLEPTNSSGFVVKPVSGAASESVYFAKDWDHALELVEKVRGDYALSTEFKQSPIRTATWKGEKIELFEDVLVEERLQGAEFTVDGCIQAGKCNFVIQHKEGTHSGMFYGDGLIVSPPDAKWDHRQIATIVDTEPSPSFTFVSEEFQELLESGLKALAIRNWAFHAEVILTVLGLRFIELNPRGAGGLLWETAGRHLGLDPFHMIAHIVTQASFFCTPKSNIVTGQFPIYAHRVGKFVGFRNLHEARQVAGVENIVIVSEGPLEIKNMAKENYLAFVHVSGDTHEAVRKAAAAVSELLIPQFDDVCE